MYFSVVDLTRLRFFQYDMNAAVDICPASVCFLQATDKPRRLLLFHLRHYSCFFQSVHDTEINDKH